jgi:8-oxo-dGTP pyrophosphatase MutT (NUDIX family)
MKEWDEFYPTNSPLNEAQLKERSIKICALRETFEEAGVLLTECLSVGGGKKKWEGITESERRVWRDKVTSLS